MARLRESAGVVFALRRGLASALRRVISFLESNKAHTQMPPGEFAALAALRAQYPDAPDHWLKFLSEKGGHPQPLENTLSAVLPPATDKGAQPKMFVVPEGDELEEQRPRAVLPQASTPAQNILPRFLCNEDEGAVRTTAATLPENRSQNKAIPIRIMAEDVAGPKVGVSFVDEGAAAPVGKRQLQFLSGDRGVSCAGDMGVKPSGRDASKQRSPRRKAGLVNDPVKIEGCPEDGFQVAFPTDPIYVADGREATHSVRDESPSLRYEAAVEEGPESADLGRVSLMPHDDVEKPNAAFQGVAEMPPWPPLPPLWECSEEAPQQSRVIQSYFSSFTERAERWNALPF